MTAIDWSKAPEGATYVNGAGVFLRTDVYGRVSEYEKGLWRKTSKHLTDFDPGYLDERPAQWNGEGPPPVGVRIEARHKDAQPDWARPSWYETEIVAMGKQLCIFESDGSGFEKVGELKRYEFRPLRTPEQVAAENREKKAQALFELVNPDGDWHKFWEEGKEHYRAFIDAGYLKQEKHDEQK